MAKDKFTFLIHNTVWFGKRHWQNFSYTKAFLSAVLMKDNYNISIIDANVENLNEEYVRKKIQDINPDYVEISAMTVEYKDCVHKSFQLVKETNSCVNVKTVDVISLNSENKPKK